jgi:selenocysteine-specific elongation factor
VGKTCSPVLWRGVLDLLIRSRAIARSGTSLHLPGHRAQLAAADEAAFEKMASSFSADTLRPMALKDLAAMLDVDRDALNALLLRVSASGRLLRVAENRFYHPSALLKLALVAQALDAASDSAGFEARAFRDATEVGRNLAIDILEYFDRQGYTRRIKQTRRVIADPNLIFAQY